MNLDFQKQIGFVVILFLFVCSTTFANEHNRIASKLMLTQNCSFDINSFNLTSENVQALRTQQLETIQNANQITKLSMDKLVDQNSALRSLAFTLTLGLRFGNTFITRPEDIQLGSGHLNFRKSINSTGDVLKRFGHELNKMVEKLELVSGIESIGSFFQVNQEHWFAGQLNQIIDTTLNQMIRVEFRETPAFHGIFITVLNGFKFDLNLKGIGQFNLRKSVEDSNERLNQFANGLIDIANQWDQQLVQQQQKCELYLKDTFTPVEINPGSNTTVVVIGNNETMQTNSLTTTVSPVSQVVANLTNIAKQLNIDQLATQILSIYNSTFLN